MGLKPIAMKKLALTIAADTGPRLRPAGVWAESVGRRQRPNQYL